MAGDQPNQHPNENPEQQPNASDRGPNAGASAHPDQTQAPTIVKRKTIGRRVLGISFWVLLSVLVVSFSTLIFIQLPIFRRIIVNELVKTVESSTNGTLIIKDIQGNLLSGFVMNDVSLELRTGTKYDSVSILHADHILADYSIIRLIRKNEIGITNMVIQRPTIRLIKFAGDTVWNYHLLFKPVPTAPKAQPAPFTQIVDLASLRIQDGSVFIRDYNYPARETKTVGASAAQVKENEIDWADAQIQGLDLDSRFYANGSTAQSVRVSHLRFAEKQSGFFIQHLEFAGYIDSIQARMDNAKITTGHSNVDFSIEVVPPKIIKTGLITSMQHSSVELTLKGPTISTYELKQFLPDALGFLNGSPGIDLVTHGEFGRLHIDRLGLDFKQRGDILLSGDLYNLQEPDSLKMNLGLVAHNLSNATLIDYVPGLHIPDLSRFGTITIPSLKYSGEPLNFHTIFDARSTGAGNIAGDVILDFRHNKFLYRAGLKSQQLNLAAFVNNSAWESSINANAQLAGSGTNWKTLTTDLALKTTAPSTFQKYRVVSLDLSGTMKKGIANVGHLEAAVEGGPEIHVRSAMIDMASSAFPYKFDGTVNGLHLAEVLGGPSKNPARVDLDANISGAGKNFENIAGTVHARLFDLAYQGHTLEDVKVDATLASGHDGENKLTLQSDMADLTIEHRFRIADLIQTIPQHIEALVTAIRNRDFPLPDVHTPIVTQCADSIDFDYDLKIKDLRPLVDFIPQTFLLAEGTISGAVYGCPTGDISLIMEGDSLGLILRNRSGKLIDSVLAAQDSVIGADSLANTIAVRDTMSGMIGHDSTTTPRDTLLRHRDSTLSSPLVLPKFGAGAPRVHLTSATFRLEAHNLSNDPHNVLDHLDAKLDFLADSIVRLGSVLLSGPKVSFAYKDQALDFDIATIYNDILAFRLKGDAHFPVDEFDFALDTLSVDYFNRAPDAPMRDYLWFNQGTTHIRIAKNGLIDVDTLNVIHPLQQGFNPSNAFVQRMSLGGHLQDDSIHAWARVPSFRLETLPKLLPMNSNAKTLDFARFEGTVRQLSVDLDGTLERPEIAAKLFVDSMVYNEDLESVFFDSCSVDLAYLNQALRGSVILHSPNIEAGPSTETQQTVNAIVTSVNELRAQIDSIPMIIAFKHGPDYSADSIAVLTRPLSASINATSFPIDIATPFISAFKSLHGEGDIHFEVTGTQQHIQYGGSATVKDGSLLLAATNITYLFDGKVVFANNALNLQNITIKNIPVDDPYGSALVNGFFNFQGFSITSFDLSLHSDRLMVLSNDSRGPLQMVYGPLTINTGGSDFHFYNTLKDPAIKGEINIMSAALTLPQSGSSTQTVSSEGIVYRTLPNDSLREARRLDTNRRRRARPGYADNAGSVRMAAIDDTLFPNRMKNIYRNDDGSLHTSDTSTAYTAPAENVLQPSFVDKLRMDIQVNIQGSAWVYMPFSGVFGILGAQLSAELSSEGTLSINRGRDLITHVVGTLDLTPNSTFRFYQTFNITTGKISFTNDFGNPEIYIVANYTGTHYTAAGADDQAKIELSVTGNKSQPQLAARIYTQNSATGTFDLVQETSSESLEDAIYFLASGGYLKRDLTEAGQAQILQKASQNLTSQLFSSMITNFTGSTSSALAIRSASLQWGANVGVQFTAAYRNITFRYGGAFNDPLRADYIFDIPFSTFASAQSTRNMLLELQLHTNENAVSPGSLAQQPLFLTKWVWTPFRW